MIKWMACAALLAVSTNLHAQYSLQRYDVNPGPMSSSAAMAFTEVNGKIYFKAHSDAAGREIFRINGGMVENVSDVKPGPSHTIYNDFSYMAVLNGTVYFVGILAGWQLYGIDDATKTVSAVALTGSSMVEISAINNVIDIDGKLYFAGMQQGGHDEIYSYDPASKKISQVSSLENIAADPTIYYLTNYNGLLAFSFESPVMGRELCILDPASKKQLVYDISPGAQGSVPNSFAVYKDNLYFRAFTTTHGAELYSCNPITGPQRLTDIAPGPVGSLSDVNDRNQLIPYKDGIIFMASTDAVAYDLYRYDIHTKQSGVVNTINAVTTQGLLGASAEYGGKLYLSLDSGIAYTYKMYVYDGINPLYRAGQLVGGADIKGVTNMKVCGNKLVFDAIVLPFQDNEVYTLTDSSVLNVEERMVENGVVVYPNPATTEARINFTLKSAVKLTVQLSDMQGRVVYTATKQYSAGKSEAAVPVRELAAGVYTYSVSNAAGIVLGRGKLTKQ